MITSLKFVAPRDFSIGRVRISNQAGLVHDWVATPGNLEIPMQSAEPGYYLAEIAPAGVAPQSVIFHVNEGEANDVTVPAFSALMASGSGPNFLGVDDEDAALRTVYKSEPRVSLQRTSDPMPVLIDLARRRISVGISQETGAGRESFGPFAGTHRYEMVGDRLLIEVAAGEGSDVWAGRRVRLSTSIEGIKVERQFLPMYRGGTTIGITPSPIASADVECRVTPADPSIRALLRALQAGTSQEAAALCKTILNPERLSNLLSPTVGDPWAAILAGLLFIRFPDSFGAVHENWAEVLSERVVWAYDTHVIHAHRVLSAVGGSAEEQRTAAGEAVRLLKLAQSRGSPYYSYTNQLFGEMTESLHSFLVEAGPAFAEANPELIKQSNTVLARWRREATLQSCNGVSFTWLSRDQRALKEKRLLTPMRRPSGRLRARDTTVVLSGVLESGRISLGQNNEAPKPPPAGRAMTNHKRITTPARKLRVRTTVPELIEEGPRPETTKRLSASDPNRGQFGGKAEVGGFRLSATFKQGPNSKWATVLIEVTAGLNASIELGDVAWFDLHPSFLQRRVKVLFNERRATLSTQAWGGFTVGVWLPRQCIKLECNLAKLKDAPAIIRTR